MTPSGISLRHDTRDLQALRALLVSLMRDGQHDEAVDLIIKLLADMRDHSDALQVRLHTALRQLYGRRSEKTSPEQLALFEKLLGESTKPAPEEVAKPAPQGAAGDNNDPKKKPTVLVKPTAFCANAAGEMLVLDWNGAIYKLGK
jgi:hypothetical protein